MVYKFVYVFNFQFRFSIKKLYNDAVKTNGVKFFTTTFMLIHFRIITIEYKII